MEIRARLLDALVVATAVIAVALGARRTCAHADGRVLGVALGMSAVEVRAGFAPGVPGRFRAAVSEAQPTLEWRPTADRHGVLASAELALHAGRLAGVRLHFRGVREPESLRALLGAGALGAATWAREGDGRAVATWRARCEE